MLNKNYVSVHHFPIPFQILFKCENVPPISRFFEAALLWGRKQLLKKQLNNAAHVKEEREKNWKMKNAKAFTIFFLLFPVLVQSLPCFLHAGWKYEYLSTFRVFKTLHVIIFFYAAWFIRNGTVQNMICQLMQMDYEKSTWMRSESILLYKLDTI